MARYVIRETDTAFEAGAGKVAGRAPLDAVAGGDGVDAVEQIVEFVVDVLHPSAGGNPPLVPAGVEVRARAQRGWGQRWAMAISATESGRSGSSSSM
ncbi:hypothetical protein [Nocardia sp. NPDC004860]|uniref:hypothetical protein n=1 Tax=Nocardia sp. NPDC004860 TaxID=3154557 RepID=UPI0033A92FF7